MSKLHKLFSRFLKPSIKQPGLSPGTMVYTGPERRAEMEISFIDYNQELLEHKRVKKVSECYPLKDTSTVSWININGLNDTKIISDLGEHFELHPLTMEDIVNTTQRPKMEEYEDYIYLVLKMISYDETSRMISAEQVSIIVGENYVLSFQERSGDIFDPVRERLSGGKGRIRSYGADYLAYSLMDALIDAYFVVLEKFGEDVEEIEQELIDQPVPATLTHINQLKREAMYLRKSVWPLRELVGNLDRLETSLIKKHTRVYLRDLYDHAMQVIDNIETMRDVLSNMVDMYLSSASNKMNEVMKVLTIIATIFIPITFLTGVFGMNFQYFPELSWRYSYLVFWVVVVLVIIFMVAYFKRKKWL